MTLDLRTAFSPTDDAGGYVPRLHDAQGRSGVYAILDDQTREVLYVGESHSGRMFDTLTRHFRRWGIRRSTDRRREGGVQYDREGVAVAMAFTRSDRAQDLQADEIARLDPRDNTNSFPDDPPF